MNTCNIIYKNEDTVLYTSLPTLNDLCCAICEIDFVEFRNLSPKSSFHWRTLKCRLLIHLISDVIASPISGTEKFIFVMTHKQFFESGRLKKILQNFKLVYQGLRPVTVEVYKSCLIYTIETKIAPLWNKVGQYLVQGKNFYNFKEGIRALKLDTFEEDKNICLKLHPLKVKIPCLNLEDYLPPTVISQFLANPKGYINLLHYNVPFVYVLPSTKKGKLLSVSKEIPPKSVFKNYDQLRRHWKNMYGYSLPENKDGILYYEIKFLIPSSDIFVYPNLCLASSPLETIPTRDTESTIAQFSSDLLVKLSTVCNKQLQISKHVPFNNKSDNVSSLTDTLLNAHSSKENTGSNSQMNEYAKCTDGLKEDTGGTNNLLRTQLAMIHQLHNAPFSENRRVNVSMKRINENENVAQAEKRLCIESNASKQDTDNRIVSRDQTISKFFKIQKPNFLNNAAEPSHSKKHDDLTLKEKLLKAKSEEKREMPLEEACEDVNVEVMAKNNQLHRLKISELSNWLKKHSIPHTLRHKKSELIHKIMSHINNTQVLQQFRV